MTTETVAAANAHSHHHDDSDDGNLNCFCSGMGIESPPYLPLQHKNSVRKERLRYTQTNAHKAITLSDHFGDEWHALSPYSTVVSSSDSSYSSIITAYWGMLLQIAGQSRFGFLMTTTGMKEARVRYACTYNQVIGTLTVDVMAKMMCPTFFRNCVNDAGVDIETLLKTTAAKHAFSCMAHVVLKHFVDRPSLVLVLMRTGDSLLLGVPSHSSKDMWGYKSGCNVYGELLMDLRNHIRYASSPAVGWRVPNQRQFVGRYKGHVSSLTTISSSGHRGLREHMEIVCQRTGENVDVWQFVSEHCSSMIITPPQPESSLDLTSHQASSSNHRPPQPPPSSSAADTETVFGDGDENRGAIVTLCAKKESTHRRRRRRGDDDNDVDEPVDNDDVIMNDD